MGVGPQADACLNRDADYSCVECAEKSENYCARRIVTYAGKHRNGSKTQGGYALYHRAPSHFVVKIPTGLAPEFAAPMLCAGATVYAPLKRFHAGPGKRVAVVGIGGLGHFAVLFAKALGADEVVGISRKDDKRQDALDLGCDGYIATGSDPDWATKNARKFDIILNTVASTKVRSARQLWHAGISSMHHTTSADTVTHLGTDAVRRVSRSPQARWHSRAGRSARGPNPVHASGMNGARRTVAGTYIGSPSEMREMLQVALEKNIKPWVEQRQMKDANSAILDLEAGKPRFRYVLVN